MRKPLVNTKIEIVIIHEVELDGMTFCPSDNLVGQATDSSHSHWLIGFAIDNPVCRVGWDELEQSKNRGYVNYVVPA